MFLLVVLDEKIDVGRFYTIVMDIYHFFDVITIKINNMSEIGNRIMEGGPTFMIPLVILILVIIALFIASLAGKFKKEKALKLIGHISLFALVWGFLGSTIGLITAFDAIDAAGTVSQPMMASGLKVALLTTVFGLVTFLIGRITMIVLAIKSE
jgi:hypothetical protein